MEIFREIKEKFIDINGVNLHTVIIGDGEPLVLLHGFPDFWYGWKNVILGLKEKYKLIVPDTRGVNLSDKPKGLDNYDAKLLINDIKVLSEKLNLGKFSLAGHDWGGMIAWVFGEKYPQLLKKLIVIDAPHPKIFKKQLTGDKTQQRASGYIFQMTKPGGDKMLTQNDYMMLKVAVFENVRNKGAFTAFDKQKYIEAWSQPDAIDCGINYYRKNLRFDDLTGIIKVPTLVIHGMKDSYVKPGVLEGLSDYVKDLKIVKIENASHWVMHDNPELVNSSINEFISR